MEEKLTNEKLKEEFKDEYNNSLNDMHESLNMDVNKYIIKECKSSRQRSYNFIRLS